MAGILAALVLSPLLAAMGGSSVAHAQSADVEKIRIEISENGFNGKPRGLVVEVEQGKKVEMTFVFAQTAFPEDKHVIALKGYGLETEEISFFHREATLSFVASKPGTFEFACELECEIHSALKQAELKVLPPGTPRSGAGGGGGATQQATVALAPFDGVATVGQPFWLAARVTSPTDGKAFAGVQVTFLQPTTYGGVTNLAAIGRATTDSDGFALLEFVPRIAGEHQISAQLGTGAEVQKAGAAALLFVVGAPEQLYRSEGGIHIFGHEWILISVVGAVWIVILLVAMGIADIARSGEDDTRSPLASPRSEVGRDVERFFVPALHLVAISGLAFTLIVVIISRSPYTHGNLNAEGYDRTEIAVLGQNYRYDRFQLADPGRTVSGDAARDGVSIFLEQGCAACHGFQAQGVTVGPKLKSDYSASQLQHAVREPTGGMPSYSETAVSNDAIEKVLAFLKSR